MTVEANDTWKCNGRGCEAQAVMPRNQQPEGWTGFTYVEPPLANLGSEAKERVHLCPSCTTKILKKAGFVTEPNNEESHQ